MPSSFACEAGMPGLGDTSASVPPGGPGTFAWSLPSTPPGNRLTFILPPLFAATSSANFSMPTTVGWPLGFCVANLNSCACAPAQAGTKARLAIEVKRRFIVDSWKWKSAGEPARRNGNERREYHHQEHHRELCPHEGQHTARDLVHLHAADTGDRIEHRTDRRRYEADCVVDDEQHAEVHRIDARGLDHRHQYRRKDENGRRHVHRRAHG